jgi:hypothetical protein
VEHVKRFGHLLNLLLDRRVNLVLVVALESRRKHLLKPLGDLVGTGPVEVAGQQVTDDRSRVGIRLDQVHHLLGRFLAPGGERRPGGDRHVVAARRTSWIRSCPSSSNCVDLDAVGLAVLAENADDPLARIDLGDEVNDDAARVADGARQVVDEVERRNVALALAGKDRLAAGLVRLARSNEAS